MRSAARRMLGQYRAWRWETTSSPEWMWSQLEGRRTDRQVRLFAAACGRAEFVELSQIAATFRELEPPDPAALLRTAEDHADGIAGTSLEELNQRAQASADLCRRSMHWWDGSVYRSIHPAFQLLAWITTAQVEMPTTVVAPELQCRCLRDIFGNPFRPVTLDPQWLTSTVLALARQMYESRDFSAVPILADALQDAGCEQADILDHCRGEGPHVRGCWVVDLILDKS